MSKCAVCGHETKTVCACSTLGGTSFSYCQDCLEAGAEPWKALVLYIAYAGKYPEDIQPYYQEVVKATCKKLNKTEEEFIQEVEYFQKQVK